MPDERNQQLAGIAAAALLGAGASAALIGGILTRTGDPAPPAPAAAPARGPEVPNRPPAPGGEPEVANEAEVCVPYVDGTPIPAGSSLRSTDAMELRPDGTHRHVFYLCRRP